MSVTEMPQAETDDSLARKMFSKPAGCDCLTHCEGKKTIPRECTIKRRERTMLSHFICVLVQFLPLGAHVFSACSVPLVTSG